jgi:hypothetical protein
VPFQLGALTNRDNEGAPIYPSIFVFLHGVRHYCLDSHQSLLGETRELMTVDQHTVEIALIERLSLIFAEIGTGSSLIIAIGSNESAKDQLVL